MTTEKRFYKVIDGDNMICRQLFSDPEREKVLSFWKASGEYGSVSVDGDGDIICYKEAEVEDDVTWD